MSYSFVVVTSTPGAGGLVWAPAPGAMQVGDLMVAFVAVNVDYPISGPAGWTAVPEVADTNNTIVMGGFVKVATAGDLNQSIEFTCGNAPLLLLTLAVYRNTVSGGTLVDVSATSSSDAPGNSNYAPSVTTTRDADLVVVGYAGVIDTEVTGQSWSAVPSSPETLRDPSAQAASATQTVVGALGDFPQGAAAPTPSAGAIYQTTLGAVVATTIALFTQGPPLDSIPISPLSGAYVDTAGGLAFTASYNPANLANTLTGYQFRWRVGSGAYNWYDAATAGASTTPVTNPWSGPTVSAGQSFTVTIPASLLPDGNTYLWAFNAVDQGGTGNTSSDNSFIAQSAPTVSVTGPTGTLATTNQPSVTWSATYPSGASEIGYQVWVYPQSQTTGAGFQAGVTSPTWTSGYVASSTTQSATSGALPNGTTYVPYVQVTETGSEPSAITAGAAFTIDLDPPAVPALSAAASLDPATGAPRITVVVDGADNLLSTDDASAEASLGTTTAGANTTLGRSTVSALDGTESFSLTAVAAGNVSCTTGTYAVS